ncbi:hypothetical protein E4P41_02535 [Geodermatophilus sp. DF01-2]|uniref:hypothetical protein n=1 Tax=Geodermatophilus sp. DF01-2 TaxID=2559610 RepID=UPI001073A340|nr:hypothetical protein [Geodermatophilus sp. DF01_2]TFV64136.1 hypothetical protein E4P41_02535 [Geodermatophilus sp. DF01_2]
MSSPTPEERRRRRALLRAHHPDLGGDPEAFIRAMAAFPAHGSRTPTPQHPADDVRFVCRPRGLARIAAWYRVQLRRGRRGGPPRVL